MLLFITLGCSKRQHVFHTYYGDIDIDTIKPEIINGKEWYQVNNVDKDSFKMFGEWRYLKGPQIKYFCPDDSLYMAAFPDNHGVMLAKEIDPLEIEEELKRIAE